MRIELVRRPQHSALFSALSPFIALFLTSDRRRDPVFHSWQKPVCCSLFLFH